MAELRPGLWRHIQELTYIQDSARRIWRVDRVLDGWLLCHDSTGEERQIPPQDPNRPVTFLVPTLAEAEQLASAELGAQRLGELEALAAQTARAERVARPTFPTVSGGPASFHAKGHLEIAHNVHVQDVRGRGKQLLERLTECHDALHADPSHLMRHPHHHL